MTSSSQWPNSPTPHPSSETTLDDIPAANLREFLQWALGRRKRFRVSGPSMLPSLHPDEEVLVNLTAYDLNRYGPMTDGQGASPQPGEVVIVEHPQKPGFRMIKRIIVAIAPTDLPSQSIQLTNPQVVDPQVADPQLTNPQVVDPQVADPQVTNVHYYYWIEGDNALASTDSRTFGPVPSSCILGKVTARFS